MRAVGAEQEAISADGRTGVEDAAIGFQGVVGELLELRFGSDDNGAPAATCPFVGELPDPLAKLDGRGGDQGRGAERGLVASAVSAPMTCTVEPGIFANLSKPPAVVTKRAASMGSVK